MREFYKLEIETRWLFESPTIAQFATRMRNMTVSNRAENLASSNLVKLDQGDGKRPVFFVPGGAGGEQDMLRCVPLLRRIGSNYSFFALLNQNNRSFGTVEKIAKAYLKEVRAVQPEGPYFLIGECVSGIVAYEMAQQLLARGQKVALLALLDTVRVSKRRYFSFQRNYYSKRVVEHWNQIKQFTLKNSIIYVLQIVKASVSASLSRYGNPAMRNTKEIGPNQHEYAATLLRYCPRQYHARMSLILSENTYDRKAEGGWSDLLPVGLEVYRAHGHHSTYLNDHVDATAAVLRECLEKAELEDRM